VNAITGPGKSISNIVLSELTWARRVPNRSSRGERKFCVRRAWIYARPGVPQDIIDEVQRAQDDYIVGWVQGLAAHIGKIEAANSRAAKAIREGKRRK